MTYPCTFAHAVCVLRNSPQASSPRALHAVFFFLTNYVQTPEHETVLRAYLFRSLRSTAGQLNDQLNDHSYRDQEDADPEVIRAAEEIMKRAAAVVHQDGGLYPPEEM